jgi:AI-2 transport protein TqsA
VLVIVAYSVINLLIQSRLQPKFVGDALGRSVTLTSLVFWTS